MNYATKQHGLLKELERLRDELAEVADPNGAPRSTVYLEQYVEDLRHQIEEIEEKLKNPVYSGQDGQGHPSAGQWRLAQFGIPECVGSLIRFRQLREATRTGMARDDAAPNFFRDLYHDGPRTLIKSTCDYCGHIIVESVPKLADLEWQHRLECQKPSRATAD